MVTMVLVMISVMYGGGDTGGLLCDVVLTEVVLVITGFGGIGSVALLVLAWFVVVSVVKVVVMLMR